APVAGHERQGGRAVRFPHRNLTPVDVYRRRAREHAGQQLTRESPWVSWRLGGLVSGCLAARADGSVVSGFELGGGRVAEVAVEAFGVVPVDPAEGRELDFFDGLPWVLSRTADQLGLVEAVDGLGEGVVVAVTDRADRGDRAELGETFAVAHTRELTAGIGVASEPFEAGAA